MIIRGGTRQSVPFWIDDFLMLEGRFYRNPSVGKPALGMKSL